MFCDACGAKLEENQGFCRACGKPAGGIPLMPRQSRISGHLRLLGILWIAISAFRLIPAIVMWVMGTGIFPPFPEEMSSFLRPLFSMLAVLFGSAAVLGLAAGWGLLERKPWARIFTLVMGCIALIDMP